MRMINNTNIIIILFGIWILLLSACKNDSYKGDYNFDTIKEYKNDASTVSNKMDSVEAVNFIIKQKLRELYELSALASNTNDTVLNSLLKDQLLTYFPKKDTTEISALLKELSMKKVVYTSISKFSILPKDSLSVDSIKQVNYLVNYFDADKKLLETNERVGLFVLKQEPIQFKREFKFYFIKLDQKDIIPIGVTQ